MTPRDLLPVCNEAGVPAQEFAESWCKFCFNPECTQSLAGASKFDVRVATWRERLFEHPSKMDPNDPRFAKIAAQNFLAVPIGGPLIIGASAPTSAWVDPRDLEPQTPVEAVVPQTAPPPRQAAPPPPVEPQKAEPISPVPATPKVETVAAPQQRQGPLQTPFVQGVMLAGAPPPTPKPPEKDPWEASPTPEAPKGGKVLKPGGKFRFGRDT